MNFKREKPYFIVRDAKFKNWCYIKSGNFHPDYKVENEEYFTDTYRVKCEVEKFGEVTKQKTVVTNISDEPVHINHISSAHINGIGKGGIIPWYDSERFLIHYAFSAWQGENQWRSNTLSNLGLYPASNHFCTNRVRFSSVSSQSTSVMYPLIFIEDKEMGQTYFFEIESGENWYIEIGCLDEKLYVEMNSAYCDNDGWNLALNPNETYTSTAAIFGCVDGGVEEAIKELLKYKRVTSFASLDKPYICFNDYMNCLWANPSDKKLIPLIDKAAEVGCEVFCIDDGWYSFSENEKGELGDWKPRNTLFGEYGFSGIVNYIKEKGMIPGVWLEIESITSEAVKYSDLKECLLYTNNEPAGCSGRNILDFRKEKAREYIKSVFDMLYEYGIRYIKNDYNQTSAVGYDGKDSYGEELRKCNLALYSLIDEIREKYPDMVIENCGSGGMRLDGAIMPHFHLCSTSDQEYYYLNPSIISGALACIQPEKCGIWSYPYPLLIEDKEKDLNVYFKDYNNEEETIFNMINSMFGMMYLSGHIEYADDKNTELIKEAITVYREKRNFIKDAYPIYPNGFISIDKEGFFSLGLKNEDKIMLAVWKINAHENAKTIDLSKYTNKDSSAKIIYPKNKDTEFNFINNKLTIKLKDKYSARLFEIK